MLGKIEKNRKYFNTAVKNNVLKNKFSKKENKQFSDYTLFQIDFNKKYFSTFTDGGIYINNIKFKPEKKTGLLASLGSQFTMPFSPTILDFECPIGVSNNGRFFLFKNKSDPL